MGNSVPLPLSSQACGWTCFMKTQPEQLTPSHVYFVLHISELFMAQPLLSTAMGCRERVLRIPIHSVSTLSGHTQPRLYSRERGEPVKNSPQPHANHKPRNNHTVRLFQMVVNTMTVISEWAAGGGRWLKGLTGELTSEGEEDTGAQNSEAETPTERAPCCQRNSKCRGCGGGDEIRLCMPKFGWRWMKRSRVWKLVQSRKDEIWDCVR